jgi:ABC-type sugar transport system ATPase subunit
VKFHSPMDGRHAGIETVYQTLAMSPALSITDNMFMGRELRKPGFRGWCCASSITRRWMPLPATSSMNSG